MHMYSSEIRCFLVCIFIIRTQILLFASMKLSTLCCYGIIRRRGEKVPIYCFTFPHKHLVYLLKATSCVLIAVTEDEIVEGIALNEKRQDRCLAFIRHINNINLQHPKAWRFIDMTADKQLDTEAQQLMTSLREETIPQLLPAENIFRFEADWSDDGGINEREHAAYLQFNA